MRYTKTINVVAHVVGWLLLFALFMGFVSVSNRNTDAGIPFNASILLFVGLLGLIFYTNALLLVPKLFLQKRYAVYFGIFILLLVVIYFIRPFDILVMTDRVRERPPFPLPPPPNGNGLQLPDGARLPQRRPRTDIISIILFVMIWALSFLATMVKQWRSTERRAAQAEADKANAELSFLKAQINPHFLFNTLNNIYALAVTQHSATAPSIMKLSHIMRYITDNATHDHVPLQSAVACMTDYIDLHRLRFNQKVSIDYTVSGPLEGKEIAPLILITFVENIFKYGISSHEASPVSIRLEVAEKSLHFYCQNRIFTQPNGVESTGIGIANTRQRLQFLYPGRHHLHIDQLNGLFTVSLQIQY